MRLFRILVLGYFVVSCFSVVAMKREEANEQLLQKRKEFFKLLKTAISKKQHKVVLKLCQENIAKDVINYHDKLDKNRTLLHTFVLKYSKKEDEESGVLILEALFECGANPVVKNSYGKFPLFYALGGTNGKAITLLLQKMEEWFH